MMFKPKKINMMRKSRVVRNAIARFLKVKGLSQGDYVVMTKDFSTWCGKSYLAGHIGLLREDVSKKELQDEHCEVSVQFGVHGDYGYSKIPTSSFKLADDQDRAERKFKIGKEKARCSMY